MAASLGNATVNVLARTVLFEQSLRRSLKRMSLLTAAVFAGVGGANFFGKALKDSMALEKQVARIHSLLLDNPAEQGLFSAESVRNLSNQIGITADQTAESLFYLLSSGVKAADAMDVLAQSSKTAIAQNADLKQVTDFASSALNAYGDSGLTASRANDILNRALDKGKGTMNDFAKYISSAIPIADSLGISLEQVASAGATSTLTGMSARKAFTGLKVAMQELNDPTKGLGEAFEKITGKTFRQFIKDGGTLSEGFERLGKAIGSANITTVAGAKEGGAAIQQLLQLWPQYQDTLDAVGNSAGVTDEKFQKVDKTLARQLERVKVQLQNFRGSVGDWAGPVVADALDALRDFWPKVKDAWNDGVDFIKGIIENIKDAFGDFVDAIHTIGGTNLQDQLANLGGTLMNFGQTVKDAFDVAVAAIQPFIVPIGAVAAFLVAMFGPTLVAAINVTLGAVQGFFGFLADHQTLVGSIAIAVGILTVALNLNAIALWASTTAAIAWNVAVLVATATTGAFSTAIGILGAIILANPIGALITAIVAIGAAFIYAWKNSETFRNVVKTAINVVKDTLVTFVQVAVNAVTYWAQAILESFHAILEGLGHLPKWLGGGAFDAAAAGVQNLIDGITAIRNNVNQLAADARNADLAIQHMQQSAGAMLSDEENRARARDFAKQGADAYYADRPWLNPSYKAPTVGAVANAPSFGGGGYNADDSAAKDAANKIKDALKRVLTDLSRIAKNTSKQSVDTLKNNFKTLWEDLAEAGRKDLIKYTQNQEKALIKSASKRNKTLKAVLKKYKADTLVEMAQARDKILDKLKVAKDSLKGLKDEALDFQKSIRETVLGLGNVSQASDGIGVTFTGIRNRMKKAVIETQRFNAAIKTLQKLKLDPELIKQLVEAGPEALDQAATIAASGKKGVKELNSLQGQLVSQSKALEKTAYDQFFKMGIAAAQGVVTGLEKEKAAILKAMDNIADSLVARIKKKLQIKSPSRVFGEVGENITKGLAMGIEVQSPAVNKAANHVTQQINFGPGSVAVSGVGDGAAQRAGILTGQGIVDVMAQRSIAAKLAGVQ